MTKKVSIVIPAYNECTNIRIIADRIDSVFKTLDYSYEIIFVNDGSIDTTQEVLEEIHATHSFIHFIELSRNFGHQNALKAGLDAANGDCVISMDCDMQHPPELIAY